jgi:hypothetical protein
MSYQAEVTRAGNGVQRIPVADEAAVDELIALLSGDDVLAATVHDGEEDPAIDAQISGKHGYLLYAGEELLGYSVGDPESPALTETSEAQFPAGSGLPLDEFRAALREFVATGGAVPSVVGWQDAEID